MHNHDDKYHSRPGFEPATSRLLAPVDTNEPSGPAFNFKARKIKNGAIVFPGNKKSNIEILRKI